jgi:hypothetical protein
MAKSRASSQPRKQRARSFSRYKRSETTRLVKGVIDAGLPVHGIEVDPGTGKLRVLVGKPDGLEPGNDVDNWLKKKDAHQA